MTVGLPKNGEDAGFGRLRMLPELVPDGEE